MEEERKTHPDSLDARFKVEFRNSRSTSRKLNDINALKWLRIQVKLA